MPHICHASPKQKTINNDPSFWNSNDKTEDEDDHTPAHNTIKQNLNKESEREIEYYE